MKRRDFLKFTAFSALAAPFVGKAIAKAVEEPAITDVPVSGLEYEYVLLDSYQSSFDLLKEIYLDDLTYQQSKLMVW